MKKLVLIGAGGYAKSILDSIDMYSYNFEGFIDDFKTGVHLGYIILGDNISILNRPKDYYYFVSIGDNQKRKYWYNILKSENLKVINVIDQSAIISRYATIGEGNFIGKMAIINSDAHIGNNCIINTKALIEHGCHIENNTNISTNTVINGDVKVGNDVFVGSCSVINGQLTVNDGAIIGSGSVVINDVETNTTVVGVPAKILVGGRNKNAKSVHNSGNWMQS